MTVPGRPVGFGIIGAGSFVANAAVMPAIQNTPGATIAATSSLRSSPDPRWSGVACPSYDDVIQDPGVDVVYVPLPNGRHAHWVRAAAEAGKHVLCEKPLAPSAKEAAAMFDVCAEHDVGLFEAWMTPFSPRWRAAVSAARSGQIGEVERIETSFTFTIDAGNEANYRWDPAQGGGALLDVGIYVLGPILALWGSQPDEVRVTRRDSSERGVDVTTHVELSWPPRNHRTQRTASCHVSFAAPARQTIAFIGEGGRSIEITDDAHTGDPDVDPYQQMIAAVVAAVVGREPFPRSRDQTMAMMTLLDRIAGQP